jgi:cobalt ECF transporter T component CbiQ
MRNNIPEFLLRTPYRPQDSHERGTVRSSYVEKGMSNLRDMLGTVYVNVGGESTNGFFQNLDPRVKVLFLLFFVVIVSLMKDIFPEVLITAFTLLLVILSRINLWRFYRKIISLTFLFGFLVTFPSAFNVVTPGEIMLPVLDLKYPYTFWIYHIPQHIGMTRQGIDGVIMLCLRVMNSLALSLLVLYTTPFDRIIKALQVFRVPDTFLLVMTLSYKYIFIFAKTVESMYIARKSRLLGITGKGEVKMWIAGRISLMFRKTLVQYEGLFKAMTSRGFTEEMKLSDFGRFSMIDQLACGFFLSVGIFLLCL